MRGRKKGRKRLKRDRCNSVREGRESLARERERDVEEWIYMKTEKDKEKG